MLISEIIAELEKIREREGDLRVVVPNTDEGWGQSHFITVDVVLTDYEGEKCAEIVA